MLTAQFNRVTSIRQLRTLQQAATALLSGKIPETMVRGTFNTTDGIAFLSNSWHNARNIKTAYCEVFFDDAWHRVSYDRPFDVRMTEGSVTC